MISIPEGYCWVPELKHSCPALRVMLVGLEALGDHVVIVRPKDATQHSIQTVEGDAYGSTPQAIGRVAAAAKKTSYGIVVHILLQTDDATGYGNERTLGRLVALPAGRLQVHLGRRGSQGLFHRNGPQGRVQRNQHRRLLRLLRGHPKNDEQAKQTT